ncbi:MAG: DciA family protein [Pseudomonadota bacterium]
MYQPLRPVSASIRKVAATATGKRLVMLGRLLESWDEIVGPELAHTCQPHTLKVSGKDKDKQATLHISADPAFSTALHYQQDLILSRIARVMGHTFVTKLKIVAGHVAPIVKNSPSPPSAPLTESQNQRLSKALSGIDDPDLAACLNRLGKAVIMRTDKQNKTDKPMQ